MSRLIFFHGDKGGVGKSTAARGYLDKLIREQKPIVAIDADTQNAQLHRYYQKVADVQRIQIFEKNGLDKIIDVLADAEGDVMVDLPAGAGRTLPQQMTDLGLDEALNELKARLTIVFTITRIKDSVIALKSVIDGFDGMPVDYVVVKNGHFGEAEKFSRYDGSKTAKLIDEKKGAVLLLPDLMDDVYDAMDEKNMPFHVAAEDESFSFAQRRRIKGWMRTWDAEINNAGDVL